MILVHDLYGAMPDAHTTFLGRAPVDQAWKAAFDELITVSTTKRPHGPDFALYLAELTHEVSALIEKIRPDAIHAQYCGFAVSVAFARSASTIPIIAIVRGTDVMMAERSAVERECLHEVATASAAIVAPTSALPDRIDRLTGRRFTDRLTVIPWGIPVCAAKARRCPTGGTGPMSLLHAGRLDENKSTRTVIEALAFTGQPHHPFRHRQRAGTGPPHRDRPRPRSPGPCQLRAVHAPRRAVAALRRLRRLRVHHCRTGGVRTGRD